MVRMVRRGELWSICGQMLVKVWSHCGQIVVKLWSNLRDAWPRLVSYLGGLTDLAGRATTGTRQMRRAGRGIGRANMNDDEPHFGK